MPKKKPHKAAAKAPKAPMTKRELSRWQKQKREERMALIFVVSTIALIVGVLLFGLWQEYLSPPGQIVARIGDTGFTLGTMADKMKYHLRTLDKQIQFAQNQLYSMQAQAQSDDSLTFLVQYAQQQLQQLQQQRLQIAVGTTLMEEMIEDELIKQEAQRRGITVTAADIDAEIQRQFQPTAPEPTASVTDTATITSTSTTTDTVAPSPTVTNTPGPTATPIPPDAWKTEYANTLTTFGISDVEFRRYTMEPQVWRQKLQKVMAEAVPKTGEHVHVRHILVETEEEARAILAQLTGSPPASFEELAREKSTDTASKEAGGDLGWFARGVMTAEFEAAAFSLEPGQLSDVVTTAYGFHIIKVEERDPNRPYDEDQLQTLQAEAFSNWLNERRQSSDVQRFFDSKKQNWLNRQIPQEQY